MVSIAGMLQHYRQAFDDHQARVLAEATVQIEADLVRREDFSELTATVGRLADAQERTEERMTRLADAQERTEERMNRLADAQERTEERMNRLADAQERTEERMNRLADAQERTEEQMKHLVVAQQQTEAQMKQLTLAQQRTEGEVHELFVAQKELTWTMKDVHKQLGGLAQSVGHGLEAYAMERIPRILAEHCGFVTESSVPETIYADDRGNEIDIVCRGTIAGRPAAVLCEVKTNITSHEVREFMDTVERVRSQLAHDEKLDPANIHPLFFGYRASPDTRRLIADSDAWLAFPKGMIVPG